MVDKNKLYEDLTFGIDLGIASCGWAVLLEAGEHTPEILAMGSWMFDAPETDKERTPKNQIRRTNRLLRRVIRRRRVRMKALRHLFVEKGLLTSSDPEALKTPGLDPWELRAGGLARVLQPVELAVALAHIAKRRGFKSGAKRKNDTQTADDTKMLGALKATTQKLVESGYETWGEMFAKDPAFADKRRNRDGDYSHTASREELEREVKKIFAAQRRLGSVCADDDLEERFTKIAFYQRPLQDSERLVGYCTFEPDEQRAARAAPSFERFRLLTRLINLRITSDQKGFTDRPLTPDEIRAITADLGKTAKLSVKAVRRMISLPEDQYFVGIKPKTPDGKDGETIDIASRTGESMGGTYALRKALGEDLWPVVQRTPQMLDRIAHVLSFFETNEKIEEKLRELNLQEAALSALIIALDQTALFARFKGAAGLSPKAIRKILPYLEEGLRYDEACQKAGYDHAQSSQSGGAQVVDKAGFNDLVRNVASDINSPVARKALTEALKQLWAMRNRFGLPGRIHIELARDVGNSIEKRNEIESGIRKNTAQRERERKEACEILGVPDVSSDTLLRYRLWQEQGHECVYSGRRISPKELTDNSLQVDHILPWSRFGDDSFNNKTLCFASANQDKKRKTPFEWFGGDEGRWTLFAARIEGNKSFRGFKKRNYLLKDASEKEKAFRDRNLNDTRYAARVLAEAAKLFYPPGERAKKGETRRILTRPGALTSAIRHAWGLNRFKKHTDGKRRSDARHHALDAVVVAAVGDSTIQKLTKSYQDWEQKGQSRPLRNIPLPWPDFVADFEKAYRGIFVARPERRRARGEGHAATIRQVGEVDGVPVVYERKSIDALKPNDLDRVKDAGRNGALIASIRDWMDRGSPKNDLPLSPKGDPIRKVRLETTIKPAVDVRGGAADRGDMVRVDVFSKPNARGKVEWYLVPVYRHQAMNKKDWPAPPDRAVVGAKPESEWPVMTGDYHFKFSLYPRSYVVVTKSNGDIIEGYFGGLNRYDGCIYLLPHLDTADREENGKIGAKTLQNIQKYAVDRFGMKNEIKSEMRTWHGKPCISPPPPG